MLLGATRRLSNLKPPQSVAINHTSGLLRASMNDLRFLSYQTSLDKKGKEQCCVVEVIVASPSRMDDIKPAGDVMQLYEES